MEAQAQSQMQFLDDCRIGDAPAFGCRAARSSRLPGWFTALPAAGLTILLSGLIQHQQQGGDTSMTRRKKNSTADDLLELVAMLPWWAGVALAVVSYFLLHRVASQQGVAASQLGQLGAVMTQTIWKTLATFGQYIVPLLCLGGVGMSAWRRKHRTSLIMDVAQSQATSALDGMSWREFELLVGEGFRLQGYQVMETGGGGADGGVDLVLTKPGKNGGEKFLVQCKQWRAFKVGVDVVRELYGVMAARGATGGFVVTSGRFTDEAMSFARGRNITLVDGPKLHALLRQAKADATRPPEVHATPTPAPTAAPATSTAGCPVCAKSMVKRTAKRGANAGSEFWGCTGYPACRGTRPIR
jgi:restriction system protein